MPKQKAPNSGAFLPASLMYFLSGKLMQLRSGVDTSTANPENSPEQANKV
jgi:hypothetical protein